MKSEKLAGFPHLSQHRLGNLRIQPSTRPTHLLKGIRLSHLRRFVHMLFVQVHDRTQAVMLPLNLPHLPQRSDSDWPIMSIADVS